MLVDQFYANVFDAAAVVPTRRHRRSFRELRLETVCRVDCRVCIVWCFRLWRNWFHSIESYLPVINSQNYYWTVEHPGARSTLFYWQIRIPSIGRIRCHADNICDVCADERCIAICYLMLVAFGRVNSVESIHRFWYNVDFSVLIFWFLVIRAISIGHIRGGHIYNFLIDSFTLPNWIFAVFPHSMTKMTNEKWWARDERCIYLYILPLLLFIIFSLQFSGCSSGGGKKPTDIT